MTDHVTIVTELEAASPQRMRSLRFAFLLPVSAFIALMVLLAWGLNNNPRELPSTLIGRPVPEFALPPVKGRTLGLSSADLRGEVSLVNVFASWCVPCLAEHPIFVRLHAEKFVPIHGINYKDRPADAAAWLDRYGDPFTRTGADVDGRVAIEWGVTGVPETFVVGKDGRIAYKHIGPITPQALEEKILPIIRRLQQQ